MGIFVRTTLWITKDCIASHTWNKSSSVKSKGRRVFRVYKRIFSNFSFSASSFLATKVLRSSSHFSMNLVRWSCCFGKYLSLTSLVSTGIVGWICGFSSLYLSIPFYWIRGITFSLKTFAKPFTILSAENIHSQKKPYIKIKIPKPIGIQHQMFHKLSMHINIPQRIENIAINIAITMRNHLSMLQIIWFHKVKVYTFS